MESEFKVVFWFKRWMADMGIRDFDEYQLIDLVRDARKFLAKPNVRGAPRYFGIYCSPPHARTQRWAINTDKDLLKMGERWSGKRAYIEFLIVDRENATKINEIVEQLDGENVEVGEPAIEVMDSTEEALVATEELEGDDEAESVGHDRKIGDDEAKKIGGAKHL